MTAGSTAPANLDSGAIRRLRGERPPVDPWRPHGVLDEAERTVGGTQRCRAVFLAGAECPFTCVFCDLWRFTTLRATPRGAIPRQLESALADGAPGIDCLKLYNASNFFESRALPPEDLPAVARLASGFARVVVECHPRLVDRRAVDFAGRLDGGTLELALGLETAHPVSLSRLNKGMTLDDFDRACDFASRHGLELRAFVLVGAPFISRDERLEWVARSVEHALARGVRHVALIPVRPGNGALEELAAGGDFVAPTLSEVESALADALTAAGSRAVVALDLWDIERLAPPPCCAAARIARLRVMNATGLAQPAVDCAACGAPKG